MEGLEILYISFISKTIYHLIICIVSIYEVLSVLTILMVDIIYGYLCTTNVQNVLKWERLSLSFDFTIIEFELDPRHNITGQSISFLINYQTKQVSRKEFIAVENIFGWCQASNTFCLFFRFQSNGCESLNILPIIPILFEDKNQWCFLYKKRCVSRKRNSEMLSYLLKTMPQIFLCFS